MLNMEPGRELIGYLVRHGELKNMRIWDGWGDFELSATGHDQAEHAAHWLSFDHIGRVVSSDVPRTLQTAEHIMNCCNVECPMLTTDPNLRPWAVGPEFEGKEKTPERVKSFQKYIDDPDLVIPGFESRNQLNNRIQVIKQYLASPYKGLLSVVVCHNSVIKSLLGLDDIKEAVAPGGVIAVYLNPKGEFEYEVKMGAVTPEEGVS